MYIIQLAVLQLP